jgi:hypothetical protein
MYQSMPSPVNEVLGICLRLGLSVPPVAVGVGGGTKVVGVVVGGGLVLVVVRGDIAARVLSRVAVAAVDTVGVGLGVRRDGQSQGDDELQVHATS